MFERYCCVDLEMTGLSLKRDRVIAFCAYEVVGSGLTGAKYSTLINPERPIPANTTKIHGITDSMVQDKPLFVEIIGDIQAFLANSKIVVYAPNSNNMSTDEAFLKKEFELAGYSSIPSDNFLNLQPMVKEMFKLKSLNHVLDDLKIDRKERKKHGADIDAYLLAQAFPILYESYIELKRVQRQYAESLSPKGGGRFAELLQGYSLS